MILVTGGSGFIGSHLVKLLLDQGREVTVLDRYAREPRADGATVLLGDVRDKYAVMEAVGHVEGVIHLAGVLGTAETVRYPMSSAEVNVFGGLNVLEAATAYDVPVVILGNGNYWMNNTYSITKNTVERFAHMYAEYREARAQVVRLMNVYGPGQVPAEPYGHSRVRKIIPSFVCRALLGEPVEIYGDGSQIMDMVHVSDAVRVLAAALDRVAATGPTSPDDVPEVGTGVPTRVSEIAATVISKANHSAAVTSLPMRAGEPPNSVVLANPVTLDKLNLPRPTIDLDAGVEHTVEWYRENWLPEWRARHLELPG